MFLLNIRTSLSAAASHSEYWTPEDKIEPRLYAPVVRGNGNLTVT